MYLLSVPFFHATGCHSVLVANVAAGGKLVLMHKWDAERALELIERERVTTFGGVPAMVWQVLQSPSFESRDISSVQSIGYGGAPAAPELVRRIEQLFPGRTPSNGYGLTETSSVTTMNSGVDYQRKPESVGVPVPVVDVRVVDPDGNDVPVGEVGELWIQGPNVVKGYWGMPEATEQAFGGGWFKSGDLARVDDEGFVYIVDRAKDMVIRGGENVYCAEVEAVLFEHPMSSTSRSSACRTRSSAKRSARSWSRVPGSGGHRRRAPRARRRPPGRLQGPGPRVLPRRAAAPQPRRQGAQARPTRRARRRLTRVDARATPTPWCDAPARAG